jgi:hypothetical protein
MQISRHWRMNSQRYRLEGVRYQNGEVSLQVRPTPPSQEARIRKEGAPISEGKPRAVVSQATAEALAQSVLGTDTQN